MECSLDAKDVALNEQLDAPESLASADESRWRAGVNRQARPDAVQHQVAAARALGEKRKAHAMPKEERDARRNEAKRLKRAEEKQREAAAAKEAAERAAAVADVVTDLIDEVVQLWMEEEHPSMDELNEWRDDEEDTVCESEFDDFIMWLHDEYIQHGELEPEDYERDAFVELFEDWRCSSEYEQKAGDYEADQWSGWEGESVISDYETQMEDMGCYDDAGEPEDPDDPYGGADLGYDGIDQMRDEFNREFGPSYLVRAALRPERGVVKLTLKVVPADDRRHDWDTLADFAYADMEARAYPFLTSPTQYPCVEEMPPPPRRVDYDLGDKGRNAYHAARASWYRKRTGKQLSGSVAEQEELFDNACRYLRARNE